MIKSDDIIRFSINDLYYLIIEVYQKFTFIKSDNK